nr:DUF2177 family protein [uncultured Duganella sp.]
MDKLADTLSVQQWLFGYGGALLTLLAIDAIWLTYYMGPAYKSALGELLLAQPRLASAAVFYLLFAVGVAVFAVAPALRAGSWQTAAVLGGLLGLVAYGTYDLTNYAVLKAWPLGLTVIDIVWGGLLSAAGAVAGYAAASRFG